jgi:hypothetical protein
MERRLIPVAEVHIQDGETLENALFFSTDSVADALKPSFSLSFVTIHVTNQRRTTPAQCYNSGDA